MDSDACQGNEENKMNENKKKRYPADRLKLRALLEKKILELKELQAEVEHLRQMVKQADLDAINAIAEMYQMTPEELAEIMKRLYGDRTEPLPDPPETSVAIPAVPEDTEFPEEEDHLDDEET